MVSATALEFRTKFLKLQEEVQILRRRDRELEANQAPKFNLLRLLGVEHDEVHTHSAFLAELLDPEGSHGQGDTFLKRFFRIPKLLSVLGSIAGGAPVTDWIVNTEEVISEGRLDIVVRSRARGLLLVIENKIGAKDQKDQLKRYWSWMEHQPVPFVRKCLVYLTLGGSGCSDADHDGIPYCALSYKEDVANWLDEGRRPVEAVAVREAVAVYHRTLLALCEPSRRRSMDNHEYESEVSKFLKQPENLAFALQVSDHATKLTDSLIEDFWTALRDSIRKDCRAQGWEVCIRNDKDQVQGWALDVRPRVGVKGEYFKISVELVDGTLSYGLWRNGNQIPRPPFSEVESLLPGDSREWIDDGPKAWWIARRVFLQQGLRDRKLLIQGHDVLLEKAEGLTPAICELIQSAGEFVRSKQLEAASVR